MNDQFHTQADSNIAAQADHLARAYLEALAASEGVRMKSLTRTAQTDNSLAFLDDLEEDSADHDRPRLRADLAATTVLLARAIVREKGLAKRLRKEAPVVAIATHTTDSVDLVERVLTQAVMGGESQRRYIVERDGTKPSDKPSSGNAEVVDRINRGYATVGVAPNPAKHLPSALMRLAEFRISLPAMDKAALRLVIEAVTGQIYTGEIDDQIIRQTDFSDLLMSIRGGSTPAECLERLKQVVESKSDGYGDGPSLVELDGYGAAKTWGLELAADFAEYKSGRLSWAQFDHKALLLSGPPGVGKTSFARALAKTCAVPLVDTSVAQWNAGGHLGDTLRNIADAFGRAKRSAPCILFIDEFDGISSRASMSGDHYTYWAQVVNLVLEMMAGIDDRAGVVVVAAANYPDRIDLAMKRAGRLDLEIRIERPDVDALGKIFRHHLGSALEDVDLSHLALSCLGATGADVEAYVRRARAAARRAQRELLIDDLLAEIREGREPMSAAARRRAAVHEAGHAIVGLLLGSNRLLGVSLHEGGGSTEFSLNLNGATTVGEIEDEITIALAGRAAEKLLLGGISIGSASDLRKATVYALALETKWGSGQFGPVAIDQIGMSELRLHPYLLGPIQSRLAVSEERSLSLVTANAASLAAIANALEEKGYLSAEMVDELHASAAKASGARARSGSHKPRASASKK